MLSIIVFWSSWVLIIYSYLFFPLIIDILARLINKKNTQPNEKSLPHVSIVISAYNESKFINNKILNLLSIDYPHEKISFFIGSDGSNDDTVEIIKSFQDSRIYLYAFNERRGKISVLNDLVSRVKSHSQAEILVMSDANTMFSSDAVRRLVDPFRDPKVGCVSGEVVLEQEGGVSGEGFYWKYESWIKRNESKLGFLIGCNGGIFALRRDLYEPLPPSIIVEDFVITLRLLEKGWKIVFEPDARGTEPPCTSTKAEMVRKIRIGAGNFQALTLTYRLLSPRYGLRSFAYWGHKVLRWFVPLLFLVGLMANISLAGNNFYLLLLLFQLLGATISIISYKTKSSTELPKPIKLINYFYLMNYALLCGLFRFIFGTQRVTWEKSAR